MAQGPQKTAYMHSLHEYWPIKVDKISQLKREYKDNRLSHEVQWWANLRWFMGKLFQIECTAAISAWISLCHRSLIHLIDCTAGAASGDHTIINTLVIRRNPIGWAHQPMDNNWTSHNHEVKAASWTIHVRASITHSTSWTTPTITNDVENYDCLKLLFSSMTRIEK